MKTQLFTHKQLLKPEGFISMMMILLLAFNTTYGQTKTENTLNERTIKGVISNEKGPLKDANIFHKETNTGVTTNEKGEFTFPIKLKTGDVLLVSYIGYEPQKHEIKEGTSFINLVLTEDMIEMIGALDSNKPYKSKRKN